MFTSFPSDDFAVRLYGFARNQFLDELEKDFPRLRAIKGTRAAFVVDSFQFWPVEERIILMDAFLLRAHPQARAVLDLELKPRHLQVLQKLDEMSLAAGGQWKYIPLRSKRSYRKMFNSQGRPMPADAQGFDFRDGSPARIDPKEFFKKLSERLSMPRWGKPALVGAKEWQISTLAAGRSVVLNLDFGGQSSQLGYWYNIDGEWARFLSIGRWLGVGEIDWDLCTIEDSGSVGAVLAKLTQEFLESGAQLFRQEP